MATTHAPRRYEPPRLYDVAPADERAYGASTCTPGPKATTGGCHPGNSNTGLPCQNGNSNPTSCGNGAKAVAALRRRQTR
ncbi:MAG TPA: hypothetical protein VGQ83_19155 [Polyangia bacterium]|jgi:hypothetical protein